MVKLVYTQVLGTCLVRGGGSSPLRPTKICYHDFMPTLLLLILLLFPGLVSAQSTGDLYNAAINQGSNYRSNYANYIKAKNQHLQYNTASTRQDAISKTNQILESRNAWEIAYLKYLRQTLADATNIGNYPQTVAFLDMETQINSLSGLSGTFSPADSFAKINSASAAWEESLSKTDILVAAAQMQIASTKLAALQANFGGKLDETNTKIGTPSASQKSTLDLINAKYTSSVDSRKNVDLVLSRFKSANWSKSSLVSTLNQAKSDLLDAAKLLLELSSQAKL